MRIRAHVCVHICVRMDMHRCMYVGTLMRKGVHTHMDRCMYVRTSIHACLRTCVHAYRGHYSQAATEESDLITLESFRMVSHKDLLSRRLGVAWPFVLSSRILTKEIHARRTWGYPSDLYACALPVA